MYAPVPLAWISLLAIWLAGATVVAQPPAVGALVGVPIATAPGLPTPDRDAPLRLDECNSRHRDRRSEIDDTNPLPPSQADVSPAGLVVVACLAADSVFAPGGGPSVGPSADGASERRLNPRLQLKLQLGQPP